MPTNWRTLLQAFARHARLGTLLVRNKNKKHWDTRTRAHKSTVAARRMGLETLVDRTFMAADLCVAVNQTGEVSQVESIDYLPVVADGGAGNATLLGSYAVNQPRLFDWTARKGYFVDGIDRQNTGSTAETCAIATPGRPLDP